MQILMLSWEFPPFSVGGLSQHVYELSRAMAGEGMNVEVITTASSSPSAEIVDGVIVHRVEPYPGRQLNFITWVQQLNLAMLEKGVSLNNRTGGFDIIHAHDWLAAYAGRGLKNIYHLPLIATIHATEHGRNGGLFTEEQKYIGEVEWQLIYDSWKTICCSQYMEEELATVFQTPRDKIEIIPNGVSPESFQISSPDNSIREHFAPHGEKIIFYVGRLVQEKGVQVLLRALPLVREQCPDARVVIAGTGPYEEELQRQAAIQGLDQHVIFAGYIDDYTRNQLYHWSTAAVFPSFYEPFGIVALEAMAAGTPVVVGDVGGFRETVKHGENGLKAVPGDPASLARQIGTLLSSPDLAKKLARKALFDLHHQFSWKSIARDTIAVYREVISTPEARIWKEELKKSKKDEYVKTSLNASVHESKAGR